MYKKLVDLIDKTEKPLTKQDFINAYKQIGITKDSFLEVHTSLSSFGYIINKEYDICDSLIETVSEGVVIMMAHTGEFSDPSEWVNPSVPKEWHDLINKHRKVFDKKIFVPERVGKVAALFSRYNNVKRTNHPTVSMSVLNNTDDESWLDHDLDDREMISPLYKLSQSKGKILFLGTDFDSCTSIHLTEYLSPYSNLNIFPYKRLNNKGEVETARVITKYVDDEFDNFEMVKKAYIEKYKNTNYYKQVNLGLGKITMIDANKLFEIAEEIHKNYRKQ